jgi:hypothetical protein
MDHKRNLSIKVFKNIVFNKKAFALLEGLLLWVKALVVSFGEQCFNVTRALIPIWT